ncbi:hypothetical protein L228DRAFT_283999 [Xylona heveae TC161]|uniref:Transcriptional regulator n=1 Tax=Xylona heveae (strain CBS 132557 / TC161) TaxID=1328760 RepID=A0A165G8P2_XYLHT|nr:hypothetical protein L228DRAFT_283999 [Xylona heveae TC161]KZF21876.1 hypothetical protein L228DRAFT_283999 [Xylona heveae TC161]
MSDSEASDATPGSPVLEKGLRDVVRAVFTASTFQPEELTVRRMRAAAEDALSLPANFFKKHDEWNQRSKEIIQSEAEAQHARREEETTAAVGASANSKQDTSTKSAKSAVKKTSTSSRGTKRASPDSKPAARKRQKKQPTRESEIEEEQPVSEKESEEDEAPKKPQSKTGRAKRRSVESDSEVSGSDVEESNKVATKNTSSKSTENSTDEKLSPPPESESELSELIDEGPVRKKGKKQIASSATAGKKGGKNKSAKLSKDTSDLDPQDAEIKRLQSWLLKCGIRKMWYRELAPYDTKNAKIAHLRDMLKEAGMEGRFSAEKAKQIKEERELKAELEAVQEGAKQWGHSGSENEEDGTDSGRKPRRRLARGLRELDFLGDDDGEETD